MVDKSKVKKILSIVVTVILYVFFVLCLFVLALSIFSKRDADGAVKIFGHEVRIVVSSSMEAHESTDVSNYKIKDIPVKSAVFIQLVPEDKDKANEWYGKLAVGDVLTFRYVVTSKQETITHRIVSIEEKSGGYEIVLEGDNKGNSMGVMQQTIQTWDENSYNYVIGKVTGKSYFIGLIVYALSKPIGLALIVIIPCTIIIILQVIKIVNVLNESKREKAEEEVREQVSEMEALKRRIAELEGTTAEATANNQNSEVEE